MNEKTIREIRERSEMERLIKKYMTAEKTTAANKLKYDLIIELINKQSSYINIINYIYDLQHQNQ